MITAMGLLATIAAACAMTNTAQTAPDSKDERLKTRVYAAPPAEVSGWVRDWAGAQERWKVTGTDGDRITKIEITTKVFRFVDDMTVTVDATGGGSTVNVHSASRVGKSDWGVNAKNIGILLEAADGKFGTK